MKIKYSNFFTVNKFKKMWQRLSTSLFSSYVFKKENRVVVYLVATFAMLFFVFCIISAAPKDFPSHKIIEIEEGLTLSQAASVLSKHSVIRSEALFQFLVITRAGDRSVFAGDYFFNEPISAFRVSKRIANGIFGIDPVKIRILEGSTIYEIAEAFSLEFADFDIEEFLNLAEGMEGYLFPDTYFFLPNVTPEQVIDAMSENFENKIKTIQQQIEEFGKPLEDVIIMASILEKEAMHTEDRKMVADVLWKRIDIGMPLQVDAAFLYINGKNTYNLTYDDLEIDSPYNTYKYRGLPKGPIANPSLDSILATVSPEKNPYLFYLSDKEGNIYYAEDFEEHKKNKRLYL